MCSRRSQDFSADVGSLLSVKADLSEVELSAVSDLHGVRISAEAGFLSESLKGGRISDLCGDSISR